MRDAVFSLQLGGRAYITIVIIVLSLTQWENHALKSALDRLLYLWGIN